VDHPFGDGNGRVARLIEVQILSESGVIPDVATGLLSDHYNKTRSQYYLALDGAQGDVTSFVGYALQGLLDELLGRAVHGKALLECGVQHGLGRLKTGADEAASPSSPRTRCGRSRVRNVSKFLNSNSRP
jgi:hypothetical protein